MVWQLFPVVLDNCVKIIITRVTNAPTLLTYEPIYNLKATRDEQGAYKASKFLGSCIILGTLRTFIQISSGAHPASYPTGTRRSFPRG
jgi:hypothetical protein